MADRPAFPKPAFCRVLSIFLYSVCSSLLASVPLVASELRQTPIVKAVLAARPSVVNIRGEKTLTSASTQTKDGTLAERVNGMGTGVVIDPRGYILTNHHVIDGVREIQVTSADGTRYAARLIERDSETDLAIIKIDPTDPFPVINIGTSADLMPGETVVAIGNAFGYENTVTQGIVSALHRPVQVTDAQYYQDLIQTDASINPGNSGGPLLNIDGQMIGINVAVRSGAQLIGFAIPVDKAMAVAARLLAARSIRKVWHGLELANGSSLAESGLAIESVAEASPAEQAGLKAGDAITAADGQPVVRELDFHRAILERSPGDEVDLVVRRDGDTLDLSVKLAEAPGTLSPSADSFWEVLGLQLQPVPVDEFRQKHRTRYRGGLNVTAVRPRSPAANQGIRRGDVLVGMHIWETVSLENVEYVVGQPDLTSPVKFFILRGNQTLYGFLPLSLAVNKTP